MAIGGIIGGHHRHSVVASRVAMFAHLLFLTTAVLMLVWLLRFRGGINIQSDDPEQIFNVRTATRFLIPLFILAEINDKSTKCSIDLCFL
jgi:hypothetical protein